MNELALKNINKYITISCIIVSLICIILQFRSCNKAPVEPEIVTFRDTLVIRDTITKKVFIKQEKYHYDTIVVNDTIYIRDEPRHYIDSTELYKIDINAVKLYDYKLDIHKSDTVYTVLEKQTIVQKDKKFGQAVVLGVGVNYGLNPLTGKLEPTVGVSLVYGIGFRW